MGNHWVSVHWKVDYFLFLIDFCPSHCSNHVLYSNRSAAYIKMGAFQAALADAVHARELSSKWPKAYYREGVALQHLGRHSEALAAFASGLSQVRADGSEQRVSSDRP